MVVTLQPDCPSVPIKPRNVSLEGEIAEIEPRCGKERARGTHLAFINILASVCKQGGSQTAGQARWMTKRAQIQGRGWAGVRGLLQGSREERPGVGLTWSRAGLAWALLAASAQLQP